MRRARAARLRAAGVTAAAAFLRRQIGRHVAVLVETDNTGRTEHYAPVRLDGPALAAGTLVSARVVDAADALLIARPETIDRPPRQPDPPPAPVIKETAPA